MNKSDPTTDFDSALDAFTHLKTEIEEQHLIDGPTNESDARAKIVARILRDVLGWPAKKIEQEKPADDGYLVYKLVAGTTSVVIETKRSGKYFSFPTAVGREHSSYIIQNMRSGGKELLDAIIQARSYADDLGCEFGCVTDGSQWAIFRAITPGSAWKEGKALVFRSLDDIHDRFVDFLNIISYDAVRNRAIRTAFSESTFSTLKYVKAIENLPYADNPMQRNALSSHIQPLIESLFKDIISPQSEAVLRECYVSDRKVEGIERSVESVFLDTIPRFARDAGFQDLVDTDLRSGALDTDFKQAVERGIFGTTILLLGGIGAGKTTFIHRFLRVSAQDFVRKHCEWFYIPFTQAPQNADQFKDFLRQTILAQCKERQADFSSLDALRKIYADDLDIRTRGVWAPLPDNTRAFKESEFLERMLESVEHCDHFLKHLRRKGLAVVLVLDNVDQRDSDEQARVFLLGEELCRMFDAIVMVALREESFFRASQTGAFNAYHKTRYHIASPDVRKVLSKRLELARQVSGRGEDKLRDFLRTAAALDVDRILHFMNILNTGALERNPAIALFIDSLCQGNIREGLEMFNQFMVSGSTNVNKMLDIYDRQGIYHVAEHEFVKAVMLGDYQFYREDRSSILNLYNVSSASNASNLTSLRLLSRLEHSKAISHAEGAGFLDLSNIYEAFECAFGDEDDVRFHMSRLARNRLVQTEARDASQVGDAKAVQITKAGSYYLKTLCSRFVYLDLVSLDTPVWDLHVAGKLSIRPGDTDLYARIERVEWFLCFLRAESRRSLIDAAHGASVQVTNPELIDSICTRCRNDITRVTQNAGLDAKVVEQIREQVKEYDPKLSGSHKAAESHHGEKKPKRRRPFPPRFMKRP
jgi:hypothetical protein